MTAPKAFMSYCWSSPAHEQWVLDLATHLRENGVDVILDKWDLKAGHDANAFMEQMVTDPSVQKVIIVSDRVYAEKANSRRGGVGTETQIISSHIYASAAQDKFVAVIAEVDAEGKPFLPAYHGSRIFIDLSREEIYPQNLEQLVRWIFGKPAFPKPQIGKAPAYIDETSVLLPTRSRAARVVDLLHKGSPLSEASLRDYLDTLAENFEALRVNEKAEPFDQAVVDSIDAFLPYRDEYVQTIVTLARNNPTDNAITLVKRFFESLLPFCYPPETLSTYSTLWFDNYKFIIQELFLYTVAVLLKHERFDAIDLLVGGGFYVGGIREWTHDPIQGVHILRWPLGSLEEVRKRRLSLNRASLAADIIKERSKVAGVTFNDLMQADLVLFMRDAADSFKVGGHNRWYPDTLVFAERRFSPFEIFARSRSARYFDRVKVAMNIVDKAELIRIVAEFGKTLYRPQWGYSALNPAELIGVDQIATIT